MFNYNTTTVRRRRTTGMGKYKNKCKKMGSIYIKNELIGKKVSVVDFDELNKFIKKYKHSVRELKKIEKILYNFKNKE